MASVVAFAAAPTAFADATWTKVSRDNLPNTAIPWLALDGGRVVAGWLFDDPANPSLGLDGVEVLSFVASTTRDALDPQGPTNVTPTSLSTGLWSFAQRPDGGIQVVVSARLPGDTSPYVHVSPRNADGSLGPIQRISDSATVWGSASGGLGLPDGSVLFASSVSGGIRIGRGSPTAPAIAVGAANLQEALGDGSGYTPVIGQTRSGQVWVAWYSSATNNVGLFMQQVDPATAQPIGAAVRAPQSEAVGNNANATTLACFDACRLVYQIDALALGETMNRIATWAPGEASPVLVARQDGGLAVAAAYRADGRLWVAWHQNGSQALSGSGYRATLGDGRGTGGTVQNIGAPRDMLTSYGLRGLAVGNDLVLTTNVALNDVSLGPSIWVNVVAPPAEAADVPETLEVREEGGKLKIRVQYRLKSPCATPCTGRAEIRARKGKRLKTGAEPLPGDSTVLGTRKGIALATSNAKQRFDIVVSKAKLRAAKGTVTGSVKFIETRLRIRLKQADGSELVTFRDGRIKIALDKLG